MRSAYVVRLRPDTCQIPVRPGVIFVYREYTSWYLDTSASTIGRGPTRVISPLIMFHNCGSSSKLVFLNHLPRQVIRGSLRSFWCAAHSLRISSLLDRH